MDERSRALLAQYRAAESRPSKRVTDATARQQVMFGAKLKTFGRVPWPVARRDKRSKPRSVFAMR
jgi:hypothetical protein